MNATVPFTTKSYQPRSNLLLSSWLTRELPPRDYLLGGVLCTTSRWLIFGETGIGKTLFAFDLAGAVAAAGDLLNWAGQRRARVMYLDGEMPAETFKERMKVVADRYGNDLELYGYNREVLPDGEMPPLNTEEGEKWLWREIDAIKPDLIIFDSIMCLLAGSMAEEESWAPVKLLVRKTSSKRIAQIWLHHTGHDTTKGFGTKTREWEMDTVVSLIKADDGGARISLEFKKARLRVPENREQFESRTIRRGPDGWIVDGAGAALGRNARSQELTQIKWALLGAYDRLSSAVEPAPGFDGSPVRKVSVNALRDEVKSRGFLETNETGGITPRARVYFQRAKADVIAAKIYLEAEGNFWKLSTCP